jgi:hypothetical protein
MCLLVKVSRRDGSLVVVRNAKRVAGVIRIETARPVKERLTSVL